MKRIFLFIAIIINIISLKAQNNIETYNIISDSYKSLIQDTVLIRNINGGTIITPIFDDSCPEEMKTPFIFACKIVEEYMPPCLPIKVRISCGRVNSSQNAISKVTFQSRENFGRNARYSNAPLSMIKGVILDEKNHNSSKSYLDSVPNIEFLTKYNDIEITYNERKLEELSFSLENDPGEKYDFVSLAIRDLLIGLGISHKYTYNYVNKELMNPSQEMIPFEYYINEMLGNSGNGAARLEAATRGELELKRYNNGRLKLYAPTTWQNGVSLNYFIPQDDSDISNILSYDFCKGMVTRSLNDNYSGFIFRYLLGWDGDYTNSSGSSSVSSGGSTSNKMSYNGSISLGDSSFSNYGIEYPSSAKSNAAKSFRRERGIEEESRLLQYVDSFRPFFPYDNTNQESGITLSILKKDGTWDQVYFLEVYLEGMELEIKMSDCEFHCDTDEYARSIDGYLRARLTTKDAYDGRISANFFVIDYLPQKVKLTCRLMDESQAASANQVDPLAVTYYPVRIYFSDIEGVDRLVLERLRSGIRVPSKIEVKDFKQGYHDLTIDRETTFTAVAYNANGSSRSIPVTVAPITTATAVSAMQFSLSDSEIKIERPDNGNVPYSYTITPINVTSTSDAITGESNSNIDTSNLADGIYVLSVTDSMGNTGTFKFRK